MADDSNDASMSEPAHSPPANAQLAPDSLLPDDAAISHPEHAPVPFAALTAPADEGESVSAETDETVQTEEAPKPDSKFLFFLDLSEVERSQLTRLHRFILLRGLCSVAVVVALLAALPLSYAYLSFAKVRIGFRIAGIAIQVFAMVAVLLQAARYWQLASAIDRLQRYQSLPTTKLFLAAHYQFWKSSTTALIVALALFIGLAITTVLLAIRSLFL